MKDIKVHLFSGVDNQKQLQVIHKISVWPTEGYEEVDFLYAQSGAPKTKVYNREEFMEGLKEFGINFIPSPNPFRNGWDDADIRLSRFSSHH